MTAGRLLLLTHFHSTVPTVNQTSCPTPLCPPTPLSTKSTVSHLHLPPPPAPLAVIFSSQSSFLHPRVPNYLPSYSVCQSPLFTNTRRHTASFFTALTKPVPATTSFFPSVPIIPLWSCLTLSTRQTYLRNLFPNHMNTANASITVLVADRRKERIHLAQSIDLL